MPKILAIDVGIKNLALCIMHVKDNETQDFTKYTIDFWIVVDLLGNVPESLCASLLKSGKVCNKKCTRSFLQNPQDLENSSENPQGSQTQSRVQTCARHCSVTDFIVIKKSNNIKDYRLQDLALIVLTKFEKILEENKLVFEDVTKVMIESQMSINNKMKLTGDLIFGQLVKWYSNADIPIVFVPAKVKLLDIGFPEYTATVKTKYAIRKHTAIHYTKWFLSQLHIDQQSKWIKFFEDLPKKCDCADSCLYAVQELYNNNKKQIKTKVKTKWKRNRFRKRI